MNFPRILSPADLERALAADRLILLKHSTICPTAARAFREVERFLSGTEAPAAWLSVTEERPLSDRVTALTGVRHESPQAFLLDRGTVRWHASHGAITRDALAEAWRACAQASPSAE